MLIAIYRELLDAYGRQGWWPVTERGTVTPVYGGGPRDGRQRFEVAAGAVLTQNTAWANAARAIENLNRAGLLSPEGIISASPSELARTIRPAGYYNQKADRLVRLASYLVKTERPSREGLLEIKGIGPETADSIMLYGFDQPFFVIDAYTRRIFSRVGILDGSERYDEIRELFERALPRSEELYKEYHALIVELGKRCCRPRAAECAACPIAPRCGYAATNK